MSTAGTFNSNELKIFPTSKRSDRIDRNARLTSEQNLVSMINRLTDQKSFVIDGLNIEKGSNGTFTLSDGSCNIYGYYFKFTFTGGKKQLSFAALEEGEKLYLSLSIITNIINNIAFTELNGTDNKQTGLYTALELTTSKGPMIDDANHYYLCLAEYKSGTFINSSSRSLKFNINNVYIDSSTGSRTSMNDYLSNDFIIDDGDI